MARTCGALIVAALAFALVVPSGSGATVPLKGDASWVWYVSASGGSGDAIGREAARRGLDAVYVKSGDGTSSWSQFSPDLVDAIHAYGVDVCAWHFVYGQDAEQEARVSAEAIADGADCLIIDAESAYEGRYAQADAYIRSLRRMVGDAYPLALSSFPYVDYHPAFPYSVFLGEGAAQFNVPQVYWAAIGTPVLTALKHTFSFNRPYDRPIYAVGQTWQDPPRQQMLDFRRYARALGSGGTSWWSWQETSKGEWNALTKRVSPVPPGSRPARDFADLVPGDEGDLIVWAQELLLGSGASIRVTGEFDARTTEAVKALQAEAGLPRSGEIGDRTWAELLRSSPVRVRWSARRQPRFAEHGRGQGPRSAGLPPLFREIPPRQEGVG